MGALDGQEVGRLDGPLVEYSVVGLVAEAGEGEVLPLAEAYDFTVGPFGQLEKRDVAGCGFGTEASPAVHLIYAYVVELEFEGDICFVARASEGVAIHGPLPQDVVVRTGWRGGIHGRRKGADCVGSGNGLRSGWDVVGPHSIYVRGTGVEGGATGTLFCQLMAIADIVPLEAVGREELGRAAGGIAVAWRGHGENGRILFLQTDAAAL